MLLKHITMIRYLLISSLLVLFVLLGSSCKKSKENKIEGSWEYLPMNNLESQTSKHVWIFDGSDKLKIEVQEPDTTYVYNGTYTISSKFMKGYFVDVKGVYLYWNGLYKIETLNKSELILNRTEKNADSENPDVEGGAFLWKEFVKK